MDDSVHIEEKAMHDNNEKSSANLFNPELVIVVAVGAVFITAVFVDELPENIW